MRVGIAAALLVTVTAAAHAQAPLSVQLDVALYEAILDGDTESVERLIQVGTNTNTMNPSLWTPLHYAAATGDRRMIDALLTAPNATVYLPPDVPTPLEIAVAAGNIGTIGRLAEYAAWTQPVRSHALQMAAISGNRPALEALRRTILLTDVGITQLIASLPKGRVPPGETGLSLELILTVATEQTKAGIANPYFPTNYTITLFEKLDRQK